MLVLSSSSAGWCCVLPLFLWAVLLWVVPRFILLLCGGFLLLWCWFHVPPFWTCCSPPPLLGCCCSPMVQLGLLLWVVLSSSSPSFGWCCFSPAVSSPTPQATLRTGVGDPWYLMAKKAPCSHAADCVMWSGILPCSVLTVHGRGRTEQSPARPDQSQACRIGARPVDVDLDRRCPDRRIHHRPAH